MIRQEEDGGYLTQYFSPDGKIVTLITITGTLQNNNHPKVKEAKNEGGGI